MVNCLTLSWCETWECIVVFHFNCWLESKDFLKEKTFIQVSTYHNRYILWVIDKQDFVLKLLDKLAWVSYWLHHHAWLWIYVCPVTLFVRKLIRQVCDWINSRVQHHRHLIKAHRHNFVQSSYFTIHLYFIEKPKSLHNVIKLVILTGVLRTDNKNKGSWRSISGKTNCVG